MAKPIGKATAWPAHHLQKLTRLQHLAVVQFMAWEPAIILWSIPSPSDKELPAGAMTLGIYNAVDVVFFKTIKGGDRAGLWKYT